MSNGMVLMACDKEKSIIELIRPDSGTLFIIYIIYIFFNIKMQNQGIELP